MTSPTPVSISTSVTIGVTTGTCALKACRNLPTFVGSSNQLFSAWKRFETSCPEGMTEWSAAFAAALRRCFGSRKSVKVFFTVLIDTEPGSLP